MLTLCTVLAIYCQTLYSIPPQLSELQLGDSPLATRWEQAKAVPGQFVTVRFRIKQAFILGESYSMECELLNPHGQRVMHVNQPVKQMKAAGFNEVWHNFTMGMPTSLEPGDYQIAVKVQSPQCSVQLSKRQTVALEPMKLAFAMGAFSYDMAGHIPAAPQQLNIMQPMILRFAIVGLGVQENQLHYRCSLEVINEVGQQVYEVKLPECHQQATLLPGQTTAGHGGYFTNVMTTPGKYRYRLKVLDMVTWEKSVKEIPVQFHAPE